MANLVTKKKANKKKYFQIMNKLKNQKDQKIVIVKNAYSKRILSIIFIKMVQISYNINQLKNYKMIDCHKDNKNIS